MKLLKTRSSGPEVKELQEKLIKLGYPVVADGIFGAGTLKAVRSFQLSHGLSPDGIVGPITQQFLDTILNEPEVRGVDLSQWNGAIKWDTLASSGHQFFILKSTEGENFRDKSFAKNYAETKRLDLKRSAYHFYRCFSDPRKQAQNFLGHGFNFSAKNTLPPVIDVEWQDSTGATNSRIISERSKHRDNIKLWLDEVEKQTGRKPMIYTQKSFWNDILGSPKGFEKYPLWVVDYNKTSTKPVMPAGWNEWTFWQFSATGKAQGVPSDTDINRFNGSPNDFKKLFS